MTARENHMTPGAPAVTAEMLWAGLPIPVLHLDAVGLVSAVNPAAEMLLNISASRLRGRDPDRLMEIEPSLSNLLNKARQSDGSLAANELKIRFRNQDPISCRLHISGVGDGFLLVVQPLDTQGGFAPRVRSVAESSGSSAIGMSELLVHEIKNPLAGITGAAQLLEMTVGSEEKELTGLIVAECRRIVKLLSQVEEFGNLLPPEENPVNLHDVLDRACRSAELGFASGINIRRIYDPSLPPTRGDADRLVQVFLNLLKNAAEALTTGGTVPADQAPEITLRSFYEHGLRLRGRDGTLSDLPLQVEISDNGPGLPAAIADEVFEPFVSGRENGSGLGLALVSKIINAHGGWVRVESKPGRTTFRLSLPRALAAENVTENIPDNPSSQEN